MQYGKQISFLVRVSVVLFFVTASIFLYDFLIRTKPEVAMNTDERSLPAVIVVELHPVSIRRRTVGYGVADASIHADVPSEVSATVAFVPLSSQVGREVWKGDLIVELDQSDLKQRLVKAEQSYASAVAQGTILSVERSSAEERAAIAQEDLKLAGQELERIKFAFDNGAANSREVDIAKQKLLASTSSAVNAQEIADKYPSLEERHSSDVKSLLADVELAKLNLQRCRIVSPIDGVLQDVSVSLGEHVVSGSTVARVISNGQMEIPIQLPSHARPHVNLGDTTTLTSAGYGGRTWKSKITRIAPEDQFQTRTMVAYVDLEQSVNSKEVLPSGLFIKAEVEDSSKSVERWVVPRRAIREDKVMAVRDGVLKSVLVSIDYSIIDDLDIFGLPDRDWVVLSTSMQEGENIVLVPSSHLRDGMQVRALLVDGNNKK